MSIILTNTMWSLPKIVSSLLVLSLLSAFLLRNNITVFSDSDWEIDSAPPTISIGASCDVGGAAQECTGNSISFTVTSTDPSVNGVQSGLQSASYTTNNGNPCSDSQSNLNGIATYTSPNCSINRGSSLNYTIAAIASDVEGNSTTTTGDSSFNFGFLGSWYKLKNASFHKYGSFLTNFIPTTIHAYDSNDDATQRYLIMASAGSNAGVVSTGANSINLNGAKASANDWKTVDYTKQNIMSRSTFASYVKSRSSYKAITGLSDITQDGIYLIDGPLSIGSTGPFDSYNVVLVVNGAVDIAASNFNPSKSTAIVADILTFGDTTTEAHGIFYADTINFATTSSSTPLKIIGNVVSSSTADTSLRERTDDRLKPSIFIVFDPKPYLDLLPYLSTATYDWQQLQ